MPEVWLNVGMDYDGCRVSPFGKPDDALGSAPVSGQSRQISPGEHWG